jgi:hypothetical protein
MRGVLGITAGCDGLLGIVGFAGCGMTLGAVAPGAPTQTWINAAGTW